MATKHTSKDGLREKLAGLAISAALVASCGGTSQALSGTPQTEQRASVVRDPSNPYWVGSVAYPGEVGAGTESVTRPSVIRDPDNPYWRMSNARVDTYADPIRGDR